MLKLAGDELPAFERRGRENSLDTESDSPTGEPGARGGDPETASSVSSAAAAGDPNRNQVGRDACLATKHCKVLTSRCQKNKGEAVLRTVTSSRLFRFGAMRKNSKRCRGMLTCKQVRDQLWIYKTSSSSSVRKQGLFLRADVRGERHAARRGGGAGRVRRRRVARAHRRSRDPARTRPGRRRQVPNQVRLRYMCCPPRC